MPKPRSRRARRIKHDSVRAEIKTDITLWDRIVLKHELCSRPAYVLVHFQECQIDSLMELSVFVEILTESPAKAVEIALVAAGMGIRIGDEPPAAPVEEKPTPPDLPIEEL